MDKTASTVVVVGASAGGVEALKTLAAGLPPDLDAAICVVLHLRRGIESRLAEIISRAGPLPAIQVHGDERLTRGRVFVAPPDRHLIVRGRHVLALRGPPEDGFRPSIDVLFYSAGLSYGRRAVAVILSGARDDGVEGASAVGSRGGCVLVQAPGDALFPGMPSATLARDHPDSAVPLAELATAITAAVRRLSEAAPMRENEEHEMGFETAYAEGTRKQAEVIRRLLAGADVPDG